MSRARWSLPRAHLRGLAVVLWALTAPDRAVAHSWSVIVDGDDRTAVADPLEVADEVLFDLAGLGPAVGLGVTLETDAVAVVDHRGIRWSSRPGRNQLSAGAETLRLSWVRQTRTSWHVPAAVVASLADYDLTVDRGAFVLELASPTTAATSGDAGAWETFTLPKTIDEMAETARLSASQARPAVARREPVLPPSRQGLRATVGLGFRQGGEWGALLAASGLWSDWTVRFSGTAAVGPGGSDLTGHLFLEDPRSVWSIEAGSLFSEAWGYAEGLRVARSGGRHTPTLSLYLPNALTRYRDPLVAYRDDFRLGAGLSLAGEAVSDGRWSLTTRLRLGRFSGALYGRGGGDAASSAGASAYLDLAPVGLSGTYNRSSGAGRSRFDSHNLQLALPMAGRLSTSLEAWGSESELSRSRAEGATLSLPVGDVRLRLRYLFRTTELRPPGRPVLSQDQQEAVALVGWGRSRIRFDLQIASRWPEVGEASHHADLQASFALTAGTQLQLFGGFSSLDEAPERHLVRLTQDLPRGFRLTAEVGDVIGFPVGRSLLAPEQEAGSVKLLVERTWDVSTPAGGSSVGGRVLAPGAVPAPGVPVRLGPYRVSTDAEGRYHFDNVPEGSYELSLEEEGLPAHLQAMSSPMSIEVERGRGQDNALFVAPLGTIGGRVFVDRDDDHHSGAHEGVGGIVLTLGEEATVSGRDGSFAFHNLPAGRYTLEVLASRLPGELHAAAPTRFEIGLPAGESIDRLDVRLLPRRLPIVFQEM